MARHDRFEWHEAKHREAIAKHGASFDDAAAMLADPHADRFQLERFDIAHSTDVEDRWTTIGSNPLNREMVLVVVWTQRYDEAGAVTRIISARRATKAERTDYAWKIRQR